MPLISVIVPTYNRVDRLRQVIAALEQQHYPMDDYEVIVISDGSSDGTDAYLTALRSPMRLQWFSQLNGGPAAARNAGINRAQGEFIVFVDDDVVAEPQLLAEHMRAHQNADRDLVVLGPLLSPDGFEMSPWVRWEQATLLSQYEAMLRGDYEPTARQFYTGNASVRRSHILAVGGFDESFRRAEDVELAYRLAGLGLGFVFKMQAVGMHYAERSFRSWLETPHAYGRNDVIFGRDRQQTWLLSAARREFEQRNMLVRALVRICAGRPIVTRSAIRVLRLLAALRLRSVRTDSSGTPIVACLIFAIMTVFAKNLATRTFSFAQYSGACNNLREIHQLNLGLIYFMHAASRRI